MVSVEEVQRVAENARINLEEDEASDFAEEFDNILEMFNSLDEVDTEEVEPSFHPVEVSPEKRKDEVEASIDRDEVFKNTENEEDGYFKGPSA